MRVASVDLRASAEGIADTTAAQTLSERHATWARRLPSEAEALWDWLLDQTPQTLTALLAVCASSTVTAVRKAGDRADMAHFGHADRLADALGLDMAQWWQPTAESYFSRVPKARTLEALAEAISPAAAQSLAGLKKDALAARAEEKLAGTGWLPAILRRKPVAEVVEPQAA